MRKQAASSPWRRTRAWPQDTTSRRPCSQTRCSGWCSRTARCRSRAPSSCVRRAPQRGAGRAARGRWASGAVARSARKWSRCKCSRSSGSLRSLQREGRSTRRLLAQSWRCQPVQRCCRRCCRAWSASPGAAFAAAGRGCTRCQRPRRAAAGGSLPLSSPQGPVPGDRAPATGCVAWPNNLHLTPWPVALRSAAAAGLGAELAACMAQDHLLRRRCLCEEPPGSSAESPAAAVALSPRAPAPRRGAAAWR